MRYRAEDLCRLAFLFSDSFAILGALLAAYYIRFDLLGRILPPDFILAPSGGNLASYAPSIVLGAAILFLILFGTGAYDSRVLLRFRRSFFLLLKSVLIWFIAFAGISFILEFDADLSQGLYYNLLRSARGLSWLFPLYRAADRREIRCHRGPAATNSLCRLDGKNRADRSSCDERPLEPL